MKKLISLIILYVFIYSCSTGKKTLMNEIMSDGEKKDYFETGLKYSQSYEASNFTSRSDFTSAMRNFNRSISKDSKNYVAWYNIARLYFYSGNYSNSRKAIVKVLELKSDFVQAYVLYIKTYLAQNNIDKATSIVEKAKNLLKENETIKYLEASVLFLAGKNNEAQNLSKEIIRENSNYAPAYILLGNIYFKEGKLELSRLIYSKSLEIKEENPSVYSNLGLINLNLNEKNEAYSNLKLAVDKAPSSAYSHLNLSKYYIDLGDYESALNEVKIAISIYPEFSYAYNNMGLAYMKLGMYEDAKDAYEKAIEIDKNNPDVYFNFGILMDDYFSDIDKAREYYNKFVELKGDKIDKNHRVYNYLKTIKNKIIKKEKMK